jgi:hypothetical protein
MYTYFAAYIVVFFIFVGCILLCYIITLFNMPAIATEILLLLNFSLSPQHVSAPTGQIIVVVFHLKMAHRGRDMLW